MARAISSFFGFGLLLITFACGGGTPSARSAGDEGEGEGAKKSHDDPSWYDDGSGSDTSSGGKSGDATPATSSSKKKSKPADDSKVTEPEFKDGMSVNDAINAIPQGYERITIEQEALDQPLLNPEFYKPCKLAASQHFTIKFAVWDGRAVGIDIKTTPASTKAESCLLGLVKANVWRDKVRSLNISTVQF